MNIQPNMISITDISQIKDTDELFYELGYYTTKFGEQFKEEDWIQTGQFKKISDTRDFKKHLEIESQKENFKGYLKHHNFMIITNN